MISFAKAKARAFLYRKLLNIFSQRSACATLHQPNSICVGQQKKWFSTYPLSGSTAIALGRPKFFQKRTLRLVPSKLATSILFLSQSESLQSVQYNFFAIQSTAKPSGFFKPAEITSSTFLVSPVTRIRLIFSKLTSVQNTNPSAKQKSTAMASSSPSTTIVSFGFLELVRTILISFRFAYKSLKELPVNKKNTVN